MKFEIGKTLELERFDGMIQEMNDSKISKVEMLGAMRVPLKVWGDGVPIEEAALAQMRRACELPFVYRHAALMPDAHVGIGCCVGAVVATKGAIVPSITGVDLGCGVLAAKLNLTASDLPDSLGHVRSAIEAAVPHGRTNYGGWGDKGAWSDSTMPAAVKAAWADDDCTRVPGSNLASRFTTLVQKHSVLAKTNNVRHLGTLGTGNHFIELCLDETGGVWLMLHSGSRGVGGRIGSYFIELAKKDMQKWYVNLPDKDLAYFPEGTEHFNDYMEAVGWAQEFALMNRRVMLEATIDALSKSLGRSGLVHVAPTEVALNCHHNYVATEHHFGENVMVTRKGAIRARTGDMSVIPGSMGAKSFIVRGKGNRESFTSCSHGAGRKMSRTQAKKTFTLEDHATATAGVECRKDADVLDESPGAYKDISSVMSAQTDLVEVVHTLHQVVCVKG